MRLLWATPFNVHSAIATYSREACGELTRRGVNVEILRIEDSGFDTIDAPDSSLVVHEATSDLTLQFLRDFDAVIVNIGDYADYHLRALRLFPMIPVISVIHDSNLRHLVFGAVERGIHLDRRAAELPADIYDGSGDDLRASEVALFASLSCACIAHGSHYADLLQSACPGPVKVLPLCYPDLGSMEPKPSSDGSFVITTFGMINANKQPERVMRAIASSERLRAVAVYRLVGPIQDTQAIYLTELAKSLGIRQPEVYGRVTDPELCRFLSVSDVICCLRYPITEGGSASLITAIYSARPIIVSKFGSYADLPDELVWKVSYGENLEDLATILGSIEADRPAAEKRVGQLKAWANATYSASAYVDGLLPLIGSAIKAAPTIETGRTIGRKLAAMTVSPDDPVVERLELQIRNLFESAETRHDQG